MVGWMDQQHEIVLVDQMVVVVRAVWNYHQTQVPGWG
jgi:hypothetical protein